MQRDLVNMFNIERATLSGVVTTMVHRGLVTQAPDSEDQRQRMLRITRAGSWMKWGYSLAFRNLPKERVYAGNFPCTVVGIDNVWSAARLQG